MKRGGALECAAPLASQRKIILFSIRRRALEWGVFKRVEVGEFARPRSRIFRFENGNENENGNVNMGADDNDVNGI